MGKNNSRYICNGVREITGFQRKAMGTVGGNVQQANVLNQFFNRFDFDFPTPSTRTLSHPPQPVTNSCNRHHFAPTLSPPRSTYVLTPTTGSVSDSYHIPHLPDWTTHHSQPGEERAGEVPPGKGCWTRWHQPLYAEGLCQPAMSST